MFEIAFGTWRFGRQLVDGVGQYHTDADGTTEVDGTRSYDLLDTQYSENFIDTADKYGNGKARTWIGNWLEERDRGDFVIATKIHRQRRPGDPNIQGLNRRQIDACLDRLGTDYIDLL